MKTLILSAVVALVGTAAFAQSEAHPMPQPHHGHERMVCTARNHMGRSFEGIGMDRGMAEHQAMRECDMRSHHAGACRLEGCRPEHR